MLQLLWRYTGEWVVARDVLLILGIVTRCWATPWAVHMEDDRFAILLGNIRAAFEDVAEQTVYATFRELFLISP